MSDLVAGWEYTMVRDDCRALSCDAAKVSASGEDWKHEVFQPRAYKFQGRPPAGWLPNYTSMFPADGTQSIGSVARIAIEELYAHRKCVVQRIRGIVNDERFCILRPVSVPLQGFA
jgi:hypothetical protein